MEVKNPYKLVSDAMVLPDIHQLGDNYYAACFELMKLLPARSIIDQAEIDGLLKSGATVIESSSGTFALGLAILCAERGYKLIIVGDNAIDDGLKNRLLDLGVHVDIVEHTNAPGGIQQARLDRLQSHLDKDKDAFWPKQYENENNPRSYSLVAEKVAETIGAVDYLVATVGSGGSSQGLANALRLINPDMKLVGVDSLKSVIFGKDDGQRLLRGLGSSIYPHNVVYELFDQVHWLDCAEGYYAVRALHQKYQMFMGPTSGSANAVGQWLADEHKDAKILSIFPDSGHRYIGTAYSDDWLKEKDLLTDTMPSAPQKLESPDEDCDSWCYYDWNKQSFEQATGKEK